MTEFKDEQLMEPSKIYQHLKDAVHQNAVENFNDLVKKSGVDVQENSVLCEKYNKICCDKDCHQKEHKSKKAWRLFCRIVLIIGLVIGVFSMIVFFGSLVDDHAFSDEQQVNYIALALGVIFIPTCIALLIVSEKKFKKAIVAKERVISDLEEKGAKLLVQLKAMTAPLNALFDWGMPQKIIRESAPLIQLDSHLDMKKFDYMVDHYGLRHIDGCAASIFALQSGSIKGNPFILERDFVRTMGTKTYYGSIVITWTTYETDSDGHMKSVHHSQTLTASVTKPCPYYGFETRMIYCNDAAPNLTFSRQPTVDINATEKSLEKMIAKDDKKMDKIAEKSMMDDDPHDFLEMANTEFESLFHAWNRNDEREFRLLFTPLAQNNMVNLLKMKEPYGDDFYFSKNKKINVIASTHSQNLDFEANPVTFFGYNIDEMRERFASYTDDLFKAIFFDLAPILSIPLYQQNKPIEYIYKDIYPMNIPSYEQEVMANSFDQRHFAPEEAGTPSILKTRFIQKEDKEDVVLVTAYAYRKEERVAIEERMGGDGYLHAIPVTWYEYIPIERDRMMSCHDEDQTLQDYRDKVGLNPQKVFKNRIEAILRGE